MLRLDTGAGDLGHAELARGRPARGARVRLRQRLAAGTTTPAWLLELAPDAEAFVKPLDGWLGSRVRLGGTQLDFTTRADAEAFARRHGWIVEPAGPPDPGTAH
jgi:hypothetical protein